MPSPSTPAEIDFRFLAEALPQLLWTATPDGEGDYFNAQWAEYSGCSLETLMGRGWMRLLHPDHATAHRAKVDSLRAAGVPYENELLLRRADGQYRWHLGRAVPLRDASGAVTKWLGTCTDIDDRRRAEEAHKFLTEATATLVSSLDYAKTLEAVAHLAVPMLGDGCVVDVIEADGVLRRVAAVDVRPGCRELAMRLKGLGAPPPEAPIHKVLALEHATLVRWDASAAAQSARDATHLEILRGLGVGHLIIAPVRARSRAIGVLWLYSTDERPYGKADLALAEDLAGRLALALENAQLYRDAQDAIRTRDEFLAIASHELKTPLTPLKLQVTRLRRAGLSPEHLQKLEVIDRQVDRLSRLVTQLLDVSRIAGGRLAIEPHDADLAVILRAVVREHAGELRRAGSELVARVEDQVLGEWDELRMDQVFSNLLSNAIKYGDGKPIDLVLESDAETARLVVRDRGIGIAPEDQERIFGRFERAVSARHYGGFGLGLWIVRQIVEASGGTIRVESAPGQGSTFVVELPRMAAG